MANGVTNKDLYEAIERLENKIEDNFVRKEAFEPIRKGFYFLLAIIGTSVFGAIMALVVGKV